MFHGSGPALQAESATVRPLTDSLLPTRSPDRTDEQLSQSVNRALRDSGYLALRNLRITAEQGHVRLEGTVPTYYLKQVAQATALAVEGIRMVENLLTVA